MLKVLEGTQQLGVSTTFRLIVETATGKISCVVKQMGRSLVHQLESFELLDKK